MAEKKLTNKEKIFISEYLINGFNATQAAIKAGYSIKTSYKIGSENLRKPHIKSSISEQVNEILDSNKEILKAEIIEEAKKIAKSDIKTLLQYDQDGVFVYPSGDVDTSVISSIKIKQEIVSSKSDDNIDVSNKEIEIKLHNKMDAIKTLSNYLGLIKEEINLGLSRESEKFLKEIHEIAEEHRKKMNEDK
jgi:phage terminase small subunit